MSKTNFVTTREIGAIIRSRRKELGLSQEHLSEKVGVSYQQIQRYENGGSMLNVENVQRVAKALDIPVTLFFSCTDSAQVDESVQYPSPDEKTLLRYYRELDGETDKRLAIRVIRRFAKKP
jgi:transcriptional regulator with XRE-family HTH domain